nr:MAG TPA: hypothetical protein [Caudoviricetes sp.]
MRQSVSITAPVFLLRYSMVMSSLLAGLDVGEGGRVEDAPADVGLAAQIDLIVALQVAQLSIIVGVAVADDLDGDLLGIAPLEAVDEIAHKGAVEAGAGGQVGGGLHPQTVHLAGICAPCQLGVKLCAVGGGLLGQSGLEGRGQHHAGDVSVCALHQRDGGLNVLIGFVAGGDGHSLRHLGVEVIGADDGGGRAGAGIDAVEGHQVEALGDLLGEAVGKGAHVVQLRVLGGVEKLVRDAGTVLDLDGDDGDGVDGQAALGLGTVLCHDVHLLVEGEGELLDAVEGDGGGAAQLGQRRGTGGLLDKVGDQLLGEQGAFAQNVCHVLFSFAHQVVGEGAQGVAAAAAACGLGAARGRFGSLGLEQLGERLGILADGVLVLTGKPLGEVEGDADLVGDAGLELRHLKGMDAGGIVGILRLEVVVVGEGSQTVGNGGVECLLRGDGFKFCHEKTSILTDAYKKQGGGPASA